MSSLADTRREYDCTSLNRSQLETNPFKQMNVWLEQAKQAELKDATAMTLATAGNDGMPDARIVLLKQFDEAGFCWYTSYNSPKGRQLEENGQACLLFYWREFDRQVRIQGQVEKLSALEADEYFHSRPLESQFSAAASEQSQAIDSRATLEAKVAALQNINAESVERPEDWGGYRLIPNTFEFWQGRENRLHDRFHYALNNSTDWLITRLQP
jgi:pyridoxamine 5'-phosphate oxidase